MMKRIGSLMFAACASGFVAGQSFAGAADDSWYIAPQINALWLDDDRVADDDVGVTLAFGRTFSPNWDAEILSTAPNTSAPATIRSSCRVLACS